MYKVDQMFIQSKEYNTNTMSYVINSVYHWKNVDYEVN